jgi:hypothetical protein
MIQDGVKFKLLFSRKALAVEFLGWIAVSVA